MQKSGFAEKLKKKFSLGGVTLWGGILFAFLIFFDQITKILAEKFLSDGKSVKIFGKFVQLRLVYNRGISFGMFSDGSVASKVAIIVLTSLMMLALAAAYLLIDKRRKTLRLSFIFVVAGGIGNLIDRLIFRMWQADGVKGVRDMVDVSEIRFGSFNFGVCNFADFFITAGAIMLVLSFLFFDSDALFPTEKYRKAVEESAEEKGAGEQTDQSGENAAMPSAGETNVIKTNADTAAAPKARAVETEQARSIKQGEEHHGDA